MQVFLSWSGPRSKQVAQLLNDWLPRVIQSLKPWISTSDIDKGSPWSEVIGDQLKDTTTGIICLTKENKDRPWILFEAGALARGLSSSRVCTLLVDLVPSDIEPPLAQFNHTSPHDKEDMLHLLQTLNNRLTDQKLHANILENSLNVHWPYFVEELKEIIDRTPDKEVIPDRPEQDILREILENTRNLNSRVRKIEKMQCVEMLPITDYGQKLRKAALLEMKDTKNQEKMVHAKKTAWRIKKEFSNISHENLLKKLTMEFPELDNAILNNIIIGQSAPFSP